MYTIHTKVKVNFEHLHASQFFILKKVDKLREKTNLPSATLLVTNIFIHRSPSLFALREAAIQGSILRTWEIKFDKDCVLHFFITKQGVY